MARVTRFAVKSGLVVGATYYSARFGFWEGSDKTEIIFKDAYKLTSKYVSDVPVEMPELPRASVISSSAREMWNSGVITSFRFLTELPQHTSSLTSKSYNYILSLAGSTSE